MNEVEDLLRRSFAERSTEIVATPDLLDRVRQARPADRSPLRRPRSQALGAAAAVTVVVVSAWVGTRGGSPAPSAPPGHPPPRSSQSATPVPVPSRPSPAAVPGRSVAPRVPPGTPSAEPVRPVPPVSSRPGRRREGETASLSRVAGRPGQAPRST